MEIFNYNDNININNPYHFFKKSYCKGLHTSINQNNCSDQKTYDKFPVDQSFLKFKRRNVSLIPLNVD